MSIDSIIALRMLYKLVTPFEKMAAFTLGVIDKEGNFLKKVSSLPPEERNQISILDLVVINLKRILGKLPFGKTKLASYAAALWLAREHGKLQESTYAGTPYMIEQSFKKFYNELMALQEDGVPVNNSGSGDVYGTRPGEVVVPKSASNKYKRKNAAEAPKIVTRPVVGVNVKEATTLEYHDELNPKIWKKDVLKKDIKEKLLQIADKWREFAKITPDLVQDIIITGGNVNYNYTPQSDIDLHLVIDRNEFSEHREFTDEFLQDKKILWTLEHSNIKIAGYPVELYAQDSNEKAHSGQGVYSLLQDKWIQKPKHLNLDFTKDPHLQQKVDFYKDLIDHLIETKAGKEEIDALKNRIKTMRGDSIAKNGEFAFGNLVFKDLRNQGYLDKIDDYEGKSEDKSLSLESLDDKFDNFIGS